MAGCLLQVYGGLTSGLYRFNVWVAGQSQQQAAMGTTYAVTSVSAELLPASHHQSSMMQPGKHQHGALHMGHAQLSPRRPLQLCMSTARHWYDMYLQQGRTLCSSDVAEHVDALCTQARIVAEQLAPVVQMLTCQVLQGPAVQLLRSPSTYTQIGSATFAYESDAAAGFQCRLTDKKAALPASYNSCSSPT